MDKYSRLICVVYVRHNGTHLLNVNKWLVDEGHAVIKDYLNELDPYKWTLYAYYPIELEEFVGKAEYDALKAKFDKLRSEYDDLLIKYEALKAAYKGLMAEHDSLKLKYIDIEIKHKDLIVKHEKLKAEYDELKIDNERLKSAYEEVSKAFDILHSDYKRVESSLMAALAYDAFATIAPLTVSLMAVRRRLLRGSV